MASTAKPARSSFTPGGTIVGRRSLTDRDRVLAERDRIRPPGPRPSDSHVLAFEGYAMKPSLTIGVEEEYQTIDPVTRDLRSHIGSEIIAKGKTLLKEHVKAEMHQSV